MSGKSKSDNSGCGLAIVVLVVISLIIAILKAIWGLLLGLTAVAFVAAVVMYWKAHSSKPESENTNDSTKGDYYTRKCPNCGGQIKVGVSESIAHCQYCDSSFEAEHKPSENTPTSASTSETKTRAIEKLASSPITTLIIVGAVFAVLGLVGFAFSGSDNTSSSASSAAVSASATSSASSAASSASSAASSASASSSAASNSKALPSATSASSVKLKATTEFLEYSAKKVDPLTLATPDASDVIITTSDTIDLSAVGKQTVKYAIKVDGQSANQQLTFTVRDTKSPSITLSNDKPSIDQWGEFDPASCIRSVVDPVDGELARVDVAPTAEPGKRTGVEQFYDAGWYAIDGTLDAGTPGTYSYIITASDKHGNVTTKELLVKVNEVVQPAPAPAPAQVEPAPEAAQSAPVYTYIANANTRKFHVPSCPDVKKMKDSNKIEYTTTREDMINMGYSPCGHCNP